MEKPNDANNGGDSSVESTDLFGVDGATHRGFPLVTFRDTNDCECSLQESSRAVFENEDGTVDDPLGWIWLGIDDPEPKVMWKDAAKLGVKTDATSGWVPYPIPEEVLLSTRMHLNEKQVRGLIDRLQQWLDTGTLSPNV